MRHVSYSKNSSQIPIDDDGLFIKEWVVNPLKQKLPGILQTINENPEMTVIFIPAHYVIRVFSAKTGGDHADQLQAHKLRFKNFVDLYNDHVGKIINNANHSRLIWLDVVRKITVSPTGFPLTPDGTHLNWARSKVMEKHFGYNETLINSIPMVDTHKAIIDVILNIYCKNFIPKDAENTCCGSD